MLLNRVYTVNPQPARTWEMRARYTPRIVRAAMGRNLKLLKSARYKAKKQTIYDRGLKPKGRFTYKLLNGDLTFVSGTTFGISCPVKSKKGYQYAQRRNDMTGYSKRYKCRKESRFAQIAEAETKRERARNIRDAMREVNRLRA